MQIRPLFLLSLVFTITIPVQATLVAGSEKGVTAPVPDVAAFSQDYARIASDGDSFLAVWTDRTRFNSGDIHGARVTADGKRAGDDVLPIAVTTEHEAFAAVAFGGGRYLVVWTAATMLRGRFVASDGTMSAAFDIAPLNDAFRPQVVFNGSRFLLVWPTTTMFRGALVDTNGTVLKTFDIASTAQTLFEPAVAAANGGVQFVSSITDFNGVPTENGYPGDVGLTPIDANGTVGTRTVIVPATTPVFDLRAASSGNEFAVAWSTAIGIPGGTVRAVRVTPAGAGAIEVIPSEGMWLHDVGADGAGFFVIYGADSTKHLRRLGSATSAVVATPATPNSVLDVASNGARTLALVRGTPRLGSELSAAGADLYVSRLDTQEVEPLVVAPRHQSLPDVAAAGDLRLAVWSEYIGSERRLGIAASRLDAAGNAIDVNGIDLHASVSSSVGPRVASNGTDWLVAWASEGKLHVSRIAHDGTLIDAEPLVITNQVFGNDVAVSWDGTQYVVVFFRGDYFRVPRTTVHAARVSAQGTIAAPELTLFPETAANELPSIASGPDGSLVVWRQGVNLRGVLLSRSGTVTPVGLPATFTLSHPAVAWNQGTFLVAAGFRGPSGDELQWLLVSGTGVVRTPLSTFPDLAIDTTNGSPSVELEPYADGLLVYWNPSANDTVYAARINSEGILADTPKAVGTTLEGSLTFGASHTRNLGAAGNMVVYARRIGHTTRETARVYSRTVLSVVGNPRRRAVR